MAFLMKERANSRYSLFLSLFFSLPSHRGAHWIAVLSTLSLSPSLCLSLSLYPHLTLFLYNDSVMSAMAHSISRRDFRSLNYLHLHTYIYVYVTFAVTHSEMPHIQRALKDNVSLIQMGLSFNQIGDDGAQELASVLQINRVCTDTLCKYTYVQ